MAKETNEDILRTIMEKGSEKSVSQIKEALGSEIEKHIGKTGEDKKKLNAPPSGTKSTILSYKPSPTVPKTPGASYKKLPNIASKAQKPGVTTVKAEKPGIGKRLAMGGLKLAGGAVGGALKLAARGTLGVAAASLREIGMGGAADLVSFGNIASMFKGKPSKSGSEPAKGGKKGNGTAGDGTSVVVLNAILAEVKNNSEALADIASMLGRANTRQIEDSREASAQRARIIELLAQMKSTSGGPSTSGSGEGGFNLGSMLPGLPNILDLFRGGKSLVKGAIGAGKALYKGAKFFGSGALRGGKFFVDGVKDMYGFGSKAKAAIPDIIEEGGRYRSKTTGKFVSKAEGEAAEAAGKLAGKAEGKGAKIAEKALAETAEGAGKKAGKAGLKTIVAKVIGPKLAKAAVKAIPAVGLLAGLGFAMNRAMAGDYVGATGEVASGVASLVPGVGTGASLLADMGLLARDIYQETYGEFPEKDPEAGSRMEEIKKEIMDYIGANGGTTEAKPQEVKPLSGVSGFGAMAAAGPAMPLKAETVAENIPLAYDETGFGQGTTSFNTTYKPMVDVRSKPFISQSGFSAMAAAGPQAPIVINNTAASPPPINAPTKRGGAASTAPAPTPIDNMLYGFDMYGAGYP